MSKRNQQPKIKLKNLAKKDPRISNNARANMHSVYGQKPVWQIGGIDPDGKWGWKSIGHKRWEEKILPKLANFEAMTWGAIEGAAGGRKAGTNSHFIAVGDLVKEAQKRLEELQIDDLDEMFSLRLEGKLRILGIRDGRVMRIIWFDFDHEICPSGKRRT